MKTTKRELIETFTKRDWVTAVKHNRSYNGKIILIEDLVAVIRLLSGKIIFIHTDDIIQY